MLFRVLHKMFMHFRSFQPMYVILNVWYRRTIHCVFMWIPTKLRTRLGRFCCCCWTVVGKGGGWISPHNCGGWTIIIGSVQVKSGCYSGIKNYGFIWPKSPFRVHTVLFAVFYFSANETLKRSMHLLRYTILYKISIIDRTHFTSRKQRNNPHFGRPKNTRARAKDVHTNTARKTELNSVAVHVTSPSETDRQHVINASLKPKPAAMVSWLCVMTTTSSCNNLSCTDPNARETPQAFGLLCVPTHKTPIWFVYS